MKNILASASPRRRELIKKVLKDVEFDQSQIDETIDEKLNPLENCLIITKKKADSIKANENDLIISADTIVCYKDKLFLKPKDKEEAVEFLEFLSGKTHQVITAVCLKQNNKEALFYDITDVSFNPLTKEDINSYVETGDPLDKAGAYGIQNIPKHFIKKVDGSLDNVIGLPTEKLETILKSF